MSDQTMPYNHGEVCEHDRLKRQCDDCWNAWEIERLHKIIAALRDDNQRLNREIDDLQARISNIHTHTKIAMDGLVKTLKGTTDAK